MPLSTSAAATVRIAGSDIELVHYEGAFECRDSWLYRLSSSFDGALRASICAISAGMFDFPSDYRSHFVHTFRTQLDISMRVAFVHTFDMGVITFTPEQIIAMVRQIFPQEDVTFTTTPYTRDRFTQELSTSVLINGPNGIALGAAMWFVLINRAAALTTDSGAMNSTIEHLLTSTNPRNSRMWYSRSDPSQHIAEVRRLRTDLHTGNPPLRYYLMLAKGIGVLGLRQMEETYMQYAESHYQSQYNIRNAAVRAALGLTEEAHTNTPLTAV